MPFYVFEVSVPQCRVNGCKRAGTCEVRSPQNEVIGGKLCRPHADARVEDLNEGRLSNAEPSTTTSGSPKWARR